MDAGVGVGMLRGVGDSLTLKVVDLDMVFLEIYKLEMFNWGNINLEMFNLEIPNVHFEFENQCGVI